MEEWGLAAGRWERHRRTPLIYRARAFLRNSLGKISIPGDTIKLELLHSELSSKSWQHFELPICSHFQGRGPAKRTWLRARGCIPQVPLLGVDPFIPRHPLPSAGIVIRRQAPRGYSILQVRKAILAVVRWVRTGARGFADSNLWQEPPTLSPAHVKHSAKAVCLLTLPLIRAIAWILVGNCLSLLVNCCPFLPCEHQ